MTIPCANEGELPELVQSGIENDISERLSIWPFYILPYLEQAIPKTAR
jgi:hypothetical protein